MVFTAGIYVSPSFRIIRELIMDESSQPGMRITPKALEALQMSAETFLTQLFSDCYLCAVHRGRKTINLKDMKLVEHLRRM